MLHTCFDPDFNKDWPTSDKHRTYPCRLDLYLYAYTAEKSEVTQDAAVGPTGKTMEKHLFGPNH